jgi:hypothetical protein
VAFGQVDERGHERPGELAGDPRAIAHEHGHVGRHLVVARAGGV